MTTFKDKNEKELREMLTEKRKKLSGIRLAAQGGNIKESQTLRKDIARILTELNARTK